MSRDSPVPGTVPPAFASGVGKGSSGGPTDDGGDAVLAFAYGERVALIDSNTARIAARVFGLDDKWTSLRNLNLRASHEAPRGSTSHRMARGTSPASCAQLGHRSIT
jgi:hypothetical protein